MGEAHTVGSLFAGIGGMDLALEAAGFRIAWQVEIEERGALNPDWVEILQGFPPGWTDPER